MQFFLGGAALGAEGGGVAYFAHVGGFAAGAIAALGGLALKRGGKWPASEPPSPSGGPRRR
jgi:membrane associated rhomboid family serine protease